MPDPVLRPDQRCAAGERPKQRTPAGALHAVRTGVLHVIDADNFSVMVMVMMVMMVMVGLVIPSAGLFEGLLQIGVDLLHLVHRRTYQTGDGRESVIDKGLLP